MKLESFADCIGEYGFPLSNLCAECEARELCKTLVKKKKVLEMLLKLGDIAKGREGSNNG